LNINLIYETGEEESCSQRFPQTYKCADAETLNAQMDEMEEVAKDRIQK
jgi:hypothetical protein